MEELIFPDGQLPDKEVQKKWLQMVDEFFDGPQSTIPTIEKNKSSSTKLSKSAASATPSIKDNDAAKSSVSMSAASASNK